MRLVIATAFVPLLLAAGTARAQTAAPAAPPAAAPAPAAPAPAPAAATTASASPDEARPWTVGLAPRVGVVVPTSKLGAMVVGGLEIDVALPVARHRLVLGLDTSLTRPSHGGSVTDPRLPAAADYTIKETELELALLAEWRVFPPGHRVVPWIGAGPMLHMLRSTETTSIAPGDNTAQSTEVGLELGGGVDYRLGPGFVAGDVRFAYSGLDHSLTGKTNAGKVTVAAAYRVVF